MGQQNQVPSAVSYTTASVTASATTQPSTAPGVPSPTARSPVSALSSGVPGLTYTFVDPDVQFQKYLIVLIQAPSGTDPLSPPNYNARLTGNGKFLDVTIPVSPVLANAELLVHKNTSWMKEGSGTQSLRGYDNRKHVRLGGLGPAIAVSNTHFNSQPWSTVWRVPLSQICDEIIGNYSITNFPAPPNQLGQRYYPVMVEFKLKTVEQTVKKEAEVNFGVWSDSDMEGDGRNKRARHQYKDP